MTTPTEQPMPSLTQVANHAVSTLQTVMRLVEGAYGAVSESTTLAHQASVHARLLSVEARLQESLAGSSTKALDATSEAGGERAHQEHVDGRDASAQMQMQLTGSSAYCAGHLSQFTHEQIGDKL